MWERGTGHSSKGTFQCVGARRPLMAVLFALCFVVRAFSADEPIRATVCQIQNDPRAYNHQLVEITGFVSHAFEDFTIFDATCYSWPPIWLEYGGTSRSGTMYCCGVNGDRHSPKELVVEKVPIPLVENDLFRSFDKRIQPPFPNGRSGTLTRATLIGRFFPGRRSRQGKITRWGGYGHFGCCTLLAIQEITAVDSEYRDDLDYDIFFRPYALFNKGCGLVSLKRETDLGTYIKRQQEAETDNAEWAFDDPQQVASAALLYVTDIQKPSITLRVTERRQGRITYEWRPTAEARTYTVVVSHPYWLSFYSRDPNRVAWLVIGLYVSRCGNPEPPPAKK